ncbi:Probable transcriptional regulatory protein HP_0162 [Candidatus Ornithobacterium hominis]|uniref:YebC/PmpR family DNA-binding transcriptional regulator n=1 Tax=Candidatus Ornithobacterium hominis TaxID=2497989 RepID=UPI000E5B52CB|nr:YebC/PmpR family DNA-binding transcriptional regulator [Candidatus Ornithobacterium hominis]SZD71751.1 Probable transcriptional regulatory protein HP_0162 [Candidatus Ornithobacterium hominis]
MGRAFEYRKAAKFARWDKMAKQFNRIGKEITMAVKEGGPDPDTNHALRRAIDNAKGVNMPKDNVERAIKKASGADAEVYDEITFEGYAPHGIGIFVECTTNNNNRTVANVRAIFNKVGGNLGKNGELAFMFDRKGVFTIEKSQLKTDIENLELELIDYGAEDFEIDEDFVYITSEFESFGAVSQKLDEMKISVKNAELKRIPNITKNLNLEETKEILDIIDRFEQDEDVQNVYHTMDISEEIESQLEE